MNPSDEWRTPDWFFDSLEAVYPFNLDVAATPENAKCSRFLTLKDNALAKSWESEICFMNPPFSNLARFVRKAAAEAAKGATVVGIVRNDTSTKWWGECWESATEIVFLAPRIPFEIEGRPISSPPFGCALVIWTPERPSGSPTVWRWNWRAQPDFVVARELYVCGKFAQSAPT